MPQLRLTWVTAGICAAVLVGVGVLVSAQLRRRQVGAAIREVGVVLGLFGLWMFVGHLVGHHPAGGYARGDDIWSLEQRLHIATEAAVQRPLLGHRSLLVAANYYYAYAHWLSVDAVLAWLWLRHRGRYTVARTALVAFTGSCLLLHLVSTAPPRLLTQTGLVDTAARLGQSVYGDTPGISDHLSAMPSIHVGWAVLFAAVAWTTGSRVARTLTVAHAALTAYVVVVTGNHFWADGVVAALIVAVVVPAAFRLHRGAGAPIGGLAAAAPSQPTAQPPAPPLTPVPTPPPTAAPLTPAPIPPSTSEPPAAPPIPRPASPPAAAPTAQPPAPPPTSPPPLQRPAPAPAGEPAWNTADSIGHSRPIAKGSA